MRDYWLMTIITYVQVTGRLSCGREAITSFTLLNLTKVRPYVIFTR